jgi:hypothetical protein
MDHMQSVGMVFVCAVPEEAEALHAFLSSASPTPDALRVQDLTVENTLGAFSNEKVLHFMLFMAIDVAVGVAGNFVYDAIKAAPSATCVVGDAVVDRATASSPAALDAQVRAAARPADDPSALP